MQRRKRSVSNKFDDQIAAEKTRLEAQIAKLPPGSEWDALHRKVRQLETALHINQWASSPELQARLEGELARQRIKAAK
jgi:hypothetical protein